MNFNVEELEPEIKIRKGAVSALEKGRIVSKVEGYSVGLIDDALRCEKGKGKGFLIYFFKFKLEVEEVGKDPLLCEVGIRIVGKVEGGYFWCIEYIK